MVPPTPVAEPAVVLGSQPTLADAMAREPLPLARLLGYATQIAGELRLMHLRGAAHGEVSTATVLVGASGATLAPSRPCVAHFKEQSDIENWGAVLWEMLTRTRIASPAMFRPPSIEGPRHGPESVLPSAQRLALRCLLEVPARRPSMVQIYTEVRVLSLLARRYRLNGVPPAPEMPKEEAPPAASALRRWFTRGCTLFSKP